MSNAVSYISQWVVLVVDDEPDSIDLVTEVLGFYGAEVHNAGNGKEAIAVLARITPDLVLSDLSMPVMDGWGLLSYIRKSPDLAAMPVIALTAHAMSGDKDRAMAIGFTSYLTKPINALTLVKDILDCVPELFKPSQMII